jgi:hypothetical protein
MRTDDDSVALNAGDSRCGSGQSGAVVRPQRTAGHFEVK